MERLEVATSVSDSETAWNEAAPRVLLVPAVPLLAKLVKSKLLSSALVPVNRVQKLAKYQARRSLRKARRTLSARVLDIGDDITN